MESFVQRVTDGLVGPVEGAMLFGGKVLAVLQHLLLFCLVQHQQSCMVCRNGYLHVCSELPGMWICPLVSNGTSSIEPGVSV